MTTKTTTEIKGAPTAVKKRCDCEGSLNSSHKPKECKRPVVRECCGAQWCKGCFPRHRSEEHDSLN